MIGLEVSKMTPADAGEYKCVCFNASGKEESKTTISVKGKTKVLEPFFHFFLLRKTNPIDAYIFGKNHSKALQMFFFVFLNIFVLDLTRKHL